jgi:hypothetical protein
LGITGRKRSPASCWSGFAPSAAHLVDGAAGDGLAQRGVAAAEAVVHGDDAVAGNHPEGRLAVGDIACELHGLILKFASAF